MHVRAVVFACLLQATAMALFRTPFDRNKMIEQCLESNTEMVSGITQNIDNATSPCDNFYQYSCGDWMQRHGIPDDRSSWGAFSILNKQNVHVIIKLLSGEPKPGFTKAYSYYQSCMDTAVIDARGASPFINLVSSLSLEFPAFNGNEWDKKDFEVLAKDFNKLYMVGVEPFWSVGVGADSNNSESNIVGVSQGGLSLPGREYYLTGKKPKDPSDKVLVALRDHIVKSFSLLGNEAFQCNTACADRIITLEQNLAVSMWDNVQLRDPQSTYNPGPISALQKHTPNYPWSAFLSGIFDQCQLDKVDVGTPTYFDTLESTWKTAGKETVRDYIRWTLLQGHMSHLSSAFFAEEFEMSKVLSGAKKMPPREELCEGRTSSALDRLVSRLYIDNQFSADALATSKTMIKHIREAFLVHLDQNDWMDATTKEKARTKANAIREKIGYPPVLNDMEGISKYHENVKADAGLYFENHLSATRDSIARGVAKCGKPVDREEWGMSAQTVNAYYDPSKNEIVFPAGILQQPFFKQEYDMAFNFGAIGVVMGHELTHGFDDQGAQFDEKGNMRSWWEPQTYATFKEKTKCLSDQYSKFSVNSEHVNGNLTLGENTADNGGVRLAYTALQNWLKGKTQDYCTNAPFTSDQLFFLGFGQVWCSKMREQALHQQIIGDPHSPAFARVNGAVANSETFDNAFDCQARTEKARCIVW